MAFDGRRKALYRQGPAKPPNPSRAELGTAGVPRFVFRLINDCEDCSGEDFCDFHSGVLAGFLVAVAVRPDNATV